MSEFPSTPGSPTENGFEKPKSTTAMISLIAGILGLTVIPFLGSVIAVLTGSIAKKEITESEGSLGGEGMAQAGRILGWIGIGLMVLGVCLTGVVVVSSLCLLGLGIREAWGALGPMVVAMI